MDRASSLHLIRLRVTSPASRNDEAFRRLIQAVVVALFLPNRLAGPQQPDVRRTGGTASPGK